MGWLLTTATPRNLSGEMARVRDPAGIAEAARTAGQGQPGQRLGDPRRRSEWVAVDHGRQGRHGRRHHRRGLPGAPGGQPGRAIPQRRRRRERPVLLPAPARHGRVPARSPAHRPDVQPEFPGTAAPPRSWSTATTSPAGRSGTCSWITCASASPGVDYATLARPLHRAGAGRSGKTWRTIIPASARCACPLTSPRPGRSGCRPGARARPAGASAGAREPRWLRGRSACRVRAFYLDIAEWAAEDPARWGPWAVPCPVRAADIQHPQGEEPRASPGWTSGPGNACPCCPRSARRRRPGTAGSGRAACKPAQPPGPASCSPPPAMTLRRSQLSRRSKPRTWAEDPETGKRRDLSQEEDKAFWAWAAVEVLRDDRHQGRGTDRAVAPQPGPVPAARPPASSSRCCTSPRRKTDEERLLVISPELADVLRPSSCRASAGPDGGGPLVAAYDRDERVWNPPMPLMFQRRVGIENRPVSAQRRSGGLLDHRLRPPPGWPAPAAGPLHVHSRMISDESSPPRRS